MTETQKRKLVKWDVQKIKDWLEVNTDGVQLVSEEYRNNAELLQWRCKCGNTFERRWQDVHRKHQYSCTVCVPPPIKKTQSTFIQQLAETSPTITVNGQYINARTKIAVNCDTCGHNWSAQPRNLLSGNGCRNCAIVAMQKTHEIFLQDMQQVHGNSIKVISEYHNALTKIDLQCNNCSHQWKATPHKLLSGTGCPNCAGSKGEKQINSLLTELSLPFKAQYKFPDCRNKNPLPFDFVVLDSSQSPILLIEFDGIQHFEPREYFGGQSGFEYRQQNDSIKNAYCRTHSIPLLRIPYTEQDNIEQLITDKLQQLLPEAKSA